MRTKKPHRKGKIKGMQSQDTTGTKEDSDTRQRTMLELRIFQPHARSVTRDTRAEIALDPTTVSDVDEEATWQRIATLELVIRPDEMICREELDRTMETRGMAIILSNHEETTIARITDLSSNLGLLTQTPSHSQELETETIAKDVST